MTAKPLTGRKVLFIFVCAFGVIIAVNLVLAYSAVRTFPGLEVQNSYVASQTFDADRTAQQALGWNVAAEVAQGVLTLEITGPDGRPAAVDQLEATLGRATTMKEDRMPTFTRNLGRFTAPVDLGPGKWSLRLAATAVDGTRFQQLISLQVGG